MTSKGGLLTAMDEAISSGEFGAVTSVLVALDGVPRHEFYAGGVSDATLHNTRSVTKTVAGALIGIAIGQGYIAGTGSPVLPYFPHRQPVANPDPRKDAITVADLLTMSAAWQCDDNEPTSPGNEELMYPGSDWVQFALDLPARPDARPGEFRYCTAGVGVLGELLVRATGQPVQDYAAQTLFGPLGIAGERWLINPAGVAFTGGGLELTSRDLWKLGQLYLDGGVCANRQVIPASWVADSVRPRVTTPEGLGYGYLWWLPALTPALPGAAPVPCWLMSGNGGNKVCVAPGLGLVAVLTATSYNTAGMHQRTERLLTEYILPAAVSEAA